MAICRNPKCQRAYQSHNGIVVVGLVRLIRANHNASEAPAPANLQRLTELATQIYQTGAHCAGCGQGMAMMTSPQESQDVNDLLSNTEVLNSYGVPT